MMVLVRSILMLKIACSNHNVALNKQFLQNEEANISYSEAAFA